MIGKAGLAMLALLATGQSSPVAPEDGPITLRYESRGTRITVSIGPDDKMAVEQHISALGAPEARRDVYDATRGYVRLRALLKPLRSFAGKTLACDPVEPSPLGPGGLVPVDIVVRWSDGAEVKAPMACEAGPQMDEIELIRIAFGDARHMAMEPALDRPFDGPANAALVDVTGH